jgi:predicted ATPase
MLTRLKVSGFKNLVGVDVRLGPFTCIAGMNGTGKSNFFDAIQFLSALSSDTLVNAAASVRDEEKKTGDIRNLFHHVGGQYDNEMSFEAEMIIPYKGVDDLGQEAKASITFLRYSLVLAYRSDEILSSRGALEIKQEELHQINLGDATRNLLFPHSVSWRRNVLRGRRTSPLISTEDGSAGRVIKRHQDGKAGMPVLRLAASLPRTVLSASTDAESPTALLARREMQSWRLLQLEPSALRKPDSFKAPVHLGSDGSHLAATLYHLANFSAHSKHGDYAEQESSRQVYSQIANRLAELIDDVKQIWVERDDQRELLTLFVTGRDGTPHPAKSLSDGTLRFLALAVLELDPEARGLLCLEEPENGIHPSRIPVMIDLLRSIATDPQEPVGPDNPLRQVIINSHSPVVVSQVPDESLLVAELKEAVQGNQPFLRASFSSLSDTWRTKANGETRPVSKGHLLAYLNPAVPVVEEYRKKTFGFRRVADRPDLQMLLPGVDS